MQTNSVLIELDNLIWAEINQESPLTTLLDAQESGQDSRKLGNELRTASRSIAKKFAQQEKVDPKDLEVLRNIFQVILMIIEGSQLLDVTPHAASADINRAEKFLDAVSKFVLKPFIGALIKVDKQAFYFVNSIFDRTAGDFLQKTDSTWGSRMANQVGEKIADFQEKVGLTNLSYQEILTALVEPRSGAAGSVSFFSSLYYPTNPAKTKLSEDDFVNLATRAGWEFSKDGYFKDLRKFFTIACVYCFKLANEKLSLSEGTNNATKDSVVLLDTLFDKFVDKLLRPLVKEACDSQPDLKNKLMESFKVIVDLFFSTKLQESWVDSRVSNCYNSKMHETYRKLFSEQSVDVQKLPNSSKMLEICQKLFPKQSASVRYPSNFYPSLYLDPNLRN